MTITVRGGDRTYTTRTGEDGYFEVIDLRPGRYSVGVPGTFDHFYFAPSHNGNQGSYAKPVLGGAVVDMKPGRLTQMAIYLD